MNPREAKRRARHNERFWRMVFCMNGLSYAELGQMNLYEYMEAEQARLLWQKEWSKQRS